MELSNGWGRQVALTRGGLSSYLFTKLLVTAVISVVPVAVIFTAGALTTAVIDTPGRWAAAFALCCLGGIPFTLYGIMSATWLGARQLCKHFWRSVITTGFYGWPVPAPV